MRIMDTMNKKVTTYIGNREEWQVDVANELRDLIFREIPDVEERMQYGKPHYLKDGEFIAVIHVSKEKVSFMIFNAGDLPEIEGFFKSMSDPQRKVVTILENEEVDYERIAELVRKAASTLP